MEGSLHDLRQAVRGLRRYPYFVLTSVLVLGLGLGANTALLSVVHTIHGMPLPYPEADRLAIVTTSFPGNDQGGDMASVLDLRAIEEETGLFEQIALHRFEGLTLGGATESFRANVNFIGPGYLELLGARTSRGRLISDAEAGLRSREPVVVISDGLWQTAFGRDPAALGSTVLLHGSAFEIVGILSPDARDVEFPGQPSVDLWLPAGHLLPMLSRGDPDLRQHRYFRGLARLRSGVAPSSANAELRGLAADLEARFPEDNEGFGYHTQLVRDFFFGSLERPVALLLVGAVLVLLLGCANVAHLISARLRDRESELAVRAALGATRARIARQLLFEGAAISLLGTAFGLPLGALGLRLLDRWEALVLPELVQLRLNGFVFLAIAGFAVVTTLLVGVAPALRGSRATGVGGGVRGVAGGRPTGERILIVGQVAIAIVLAFGAGLTARSLGTLTRFDVGYVPERMLTARVDLPRERYSDIASRHRFARELVEQARLLPGVEGAFSWGPNIIGDGGWVALVHPDGPPPTPGDRTMVTRHTISRGAFDVFGVAIEEGRGFGAMDGSDSAQVVLVSRDLADRLWPDGGAVGRELDLGSRGSARVVGVVARARFGRLYHPRYGAWAFDPQLDIFFPSAQHAVAGLSIGVRTRGRPEAVASDLRRAVGEIDPNLALWDVRSLTDRMAEHAGPARVLALLMGIYAGVALLLAAVGVYGILSHRVTRTLPEVGVRMALGAGPLRVVRGVVGEAVRPALLGALVGVGGSYLAGRALTGLLFGVEPVPPGLLLTVPLLLVSVAVGASLLPARRVARLDPRAILMSE